MTTNYSWFHLCVMLLLPLGVLTGCGESNQVGSIDVSLEVDTIQDGWQKRVSYPNVPGYSDDSVCELWVEDGWLHARRLCAEQVVWQVVLAKVQAGVMPKIKQFKNSQQGNPSIHISYADGRYFIRDNSFVLRALRQQSDEQRPTFTEEDVLPNSVAARLGRGFTGTGNRYVTGKTYDNWYCAMFGPTTEKVDCFVRLTRTELAEDQLNGLYGGVMGWSRMPNGLLTTWDGVKMASDDGELLVAHYTVPGQAQQKLNQKKYRQDLADGRIPELDGTQWLNTDPLSWEELRGKVVLVDFWATWCGPCVKKLPAVQESADKFADDGLVVIGIHSDYQGETCEAFAKEKGLTFPLLVDSGKMQEQFAVEGFPTYFLIDRDGNVVEGSRSTPPDEKTIRKYLEQE